MPLAHPGAPLRLSRIGRLATSLLLTALVFALAVPAMAAGERTDLEWVAEQLLLDLHNEARAEQGRSALVEYRDIREVSRAWADRQADRGKMDHNPEYATQICCAVKLAENVGMNAVGTSLTEAGVRSAVTDLFRAYVGSASHRQNILDGSFQQVGIGITIRHDGTYWRIWNTVNFRSPDGSEPGTGLPSSRAIQDTCGTGGKPSFRDVPSDSIHRSTIACIERAGISSGKADGTFGPKELVSRGQIATFLMRTLDAAGVEVPPGRPCTDGPHAVGMSAMYEWGIFHAGGCDDRSLVTRSQMATWSVRALMGPMGWSGPQGAVDYFHDDNNLSGEKQGANNGVAEWGVVTGVGNDKFAPNDALRRDQMATFLARLLDAAVDGA